VDELERRRHNSEQALLDAEKARDLVSDQRHDAKKLLREQEDGRDSLISVSDIEELTGSVAREAARGAAEGFRKKASDSIELSGPLGLKIKGTLWRIFILLVMAGIIFLTITLITKR